MSMNGKEFLAYCDEHKQELERQMHEEADLMINGSDKYYEEFSEEVERHPIFNPGMRGLRARMGN